MTCFTEPDPKPTAPATTEPRDEAEANFIQRRCERFAPEPEPQYAHGKTAREHAGTSA